MRIGALVGKTEKGTFEYIGAPGDIDALDELQRKITDAGGKVRGAGGKDGASKGSQYVKTWLADVSQKPLKAKKC